MSRDPPLILIVDDEAVNIEMMADTLEDRYDLAFACNGREALRVASEAAPDLILLDVMLPDLNGYEICALLKEEPRTTNIPVIFVTGLSTVEDEATGLETGAIDYVTKPVSRPVLLARVRNHIELKKARDQLQRLSLTDALTGLANRRYFDAVLAQEWSRHRRTQAPLSLVMIDVDHFKAFNDTYGHVAGDECLQRIAEVIRDSIRRPPDLAARYGGEEFACILPETTAAGARSVAERIRMTLNALGIPNARSSCADHVTASLGAYTAVGIIDAEAAALTVAADRQLYLAKNAGRNRVASHPAADVVASEA